MPTTRCTLCGGTSERVDKSNRDLPLSLWDLPVIDHLPGCPERRPGDGGLPIDRMPPRV